MPYYSPLRYPGGKRRLASVLAMLLQQNKLSDIQYVEPYAGGSAVALSLLLEEYASVIHINDLSRPVYAFWYAALNHTDQLCRRLERAQVTMVEWRRQRAIYESAQNADLLDLGFAALFLNRTNRSGIIGGGVIGGKDQGGPWGIAARFNKTELIHRISRIGRYRSRIKLYQSDALTFTAEMLSRLGRNAFFFFDPPYIEKGEDLYLNNYSLNDHQQLAKSIVRLKHPWIVTYDRAAIDHGLYAAQRRIVFGLRYSAQTRCEAEEVMFLSNGLTLPPSWIARSRICLTPPRCEYPLYGKLEDEAPPRNDRRARSGRQIYTRTENCAIGSEKLSS